MPRRIPPRYPPQLLASPFHDQYLPDFLASAAHHLREPLPRLLLRHVAPQTYFWNLGKSHLNQALLPEEVGLRDAPRVERSEGHALAVVPPLCISLIVSMLQTLESL